MATQSTNTPFSSTHCPFVQAIRQNKVKEHRLYNIFDLSKKLPLLCLSASSVKLLLFENHGNFKFPAAKSKEFFFVFNSTEFYIEAKYFMQFTDFNFSVAINARYLKTEVNYVRRVLFWVNTHMTPKLAQSPFSGQRF